VGNINMQGKKRKEKSGGREASPWHVGNQQNGFER
jgi:hypothetical protein